MLNNKPQDLDPELDKLLRATCRKLGLDPEAVTAVGLHGDGVPHQKRKSIEVMSWNLLGKGLSERYLFSVVEKSFCCNCGCSGRHTLEKLLEVFAWSMKCLVHGE